MAVICNHKVLVTFDLKAMVGLKVGALTFTVDLCCFRRCFRWVPSAGTKSATPSTKQQCFQTSGSYLWDWISESDSGTLGMAESAKFSQRSGQPWIIWYSKILSPRKDLIFNNHLYLRNTGKTPKLYHQEISLAYWINWHLVNGITTQSSY